MAADLDDVARLRRMVAEPTSATYDDALLADILQRYPLIDAAGLSIGATGWQPVYDLNAAAAEVWGEKAAVLASDFDFTADGATFNRSQAHAQALKQQRHFAARRSPGSIQIIRPAESLVADFPPFR